MVSIELQDGVEPEVLKAIQAAVTNTLAEIRAGRDATCHKYSATASSGGVRVTVSIEDILERRPGSGIVINPEW